MHLLDEWHWAWTRKKLKIISNNIHTPYSIQVIIIMRYVSVFILIKEFLTYHRFVCSFEIQHIVQCYCSRSHQRLSSLPHFILSFETFHRSQTLSICWELVCLNLEILFVASSFSGKSICTLAINRDELHETHKTIMILETGKKQLKCS